MAFSLKITFLLVWNIGWIGGGRGKWKRGSSEAVRQILEKQPVRIF
jgi:hypothetical protein